MGFSCTRQKLINEESWLEINQVGQIWNFTYLERRFLEVRFKNLVVVNIGYFLTNYLDKVDQDNHQNHCFNFVEQQQLNLVPGS